MKKYTLMIIILLMMVGSTACNNKSNKTDVTNNSSKDASNKVLDDNIDKAITSKDSSKGKSGFSFSTTDINGKSVTNEDIKDCKLIMVNFWEPWCGPCVNEMPELEKLYKNYKDKGFTILGVFHSTDSMEDAKGIIKDNSISYPILIGNNDFSKYTTEYVPTTVFFDGDGKQLNSEAVVGAKEYDDWEKEILKYLKN